MSESCAQCTVIEKLVERLQKADTGDSALFAELFRATMVITGRSVDDIAETLGVSQPTISSWRHQRSSPMAILRPKIYQILATMVENSNTIPPWVRGYNHCHTCAAYNCGEEACCRDDRIKHYRTCTASESKELTLLQEFALPIGVGSFAIILVTLALVAPYIQAWFGWKL